MRKILFLLPLIFIFSFAKAQIPIPDQYTKAKAELAAKNYWEAMPLFREFLDENKYGNLSNYAAFHFGEAALGANQASQAIEALQPISSKSWLKTDESNYLLALAYFQNSQNLEALRTIKRIQREEIKNLAAKATFENLKSESPSFMVTNLGEFKDNPGYGAVMKVVLEGQTVLSATERAAYYELQGLGSSNKKIKDEVLDIVVILPFTNSNSASVLNISENDFVFELYQGIELANQELQNQGVKVSLNTFDSKRDLSHLQAVLQDPLVAKADVIIGPIYPEETDMVSAYSENAKIPFIHPLSNLGDRFEEMKYSYLFRPSVQSLARGIVVNLNQKNWGKRVAIGNSGSTRDEKLAVFLGEELRKEGFTVISNKSVNPRDVSEFLKKLGIKSGRDSLSKEVVDQIILLSDDPAIAQPTFALLESVSASIPTLVMDSWLTFNFANFEMLEFPNFHFIANNTLNFDSEASKRFTEKFYSVYKSNPNINSSLGYELVYLLSSNMSPSKGFDLRRNLDQSVYQKGKLTWGFNFQNSNNNQYVPVFSLEAGELKPLN